MSKYKYDPMIAQEKKLEKIANQFLEQNDPDFQTSKKKRKSKKHRETKPDLAIKVNGTAISDKKKAEALIKIFSEPVLKAKKKKKKDFKKMEVESQW
ncbi:MAG TPA: hypothetical protein VM577_07635 [Anaerovoracaceae bacterium]|nr:hypothetical protein [Anaerovoracaceae bacterium]